MVKFFYFTDLYIYHIVVKFCFWIIMRHGPFLVLVDSCLKIAKMLYMKNQITFKMSRKVWNWWSGSVRVSVASAAGLLPVSTVTAGYIWPCRGLLHLNPHVVSSPSGPPDSLPLLTSLPMEPHLHLSS